MEKVSRVIPNKIISDGSFTIQNTNFFGDGLWKNLSNQSRKYWADELENLTEDEKNYIDSIIKKFEDKHKKMMQEEKHTTTAPSYMG